MTRQANKATLENRLDTIMKKAKPAPTPEQTASPEMAPNRSKSIALALAILTVLLLFSVAQVQAPPRQITEAVPDDPVIQPANLDDTIGSLTVIQNQPGFHCYAGCSFLRPIKPLDPLSADKPQDI